VAFEVAREFAQPEQLVNRNQPVFGPGGVKHRSRVPLRKNEAVVIVILRLIRQIAHVAEEQRSNDVGGGHAGSRMAAACGCGFIDGMNSQLVGNPRQRFHGSFFQLNHF
jgi:hypothetical protein